MAGRKKKQPVIHHTSPLTVDKDQAQALRAARKIFGSVATPTKPKPLRSPIKKPNPRRRK